MLPILPLDLLVTAEPTLRGLTTAGSASALPELITHSYTLPPCAPHRAPLVEAGRRVIWCGECAGGGDGVGKLVGGAG